MSVPTFQVIQYTTHSMADSQRIASIGIHYISKHDIYVKLGFGGKLEDVRYREYSSVTGAVSVTAANDKLDLK
jgi:hypothetical protein